MKRVDIISKVVGRDGQGKPVGGGISIPMGNYALKSEFESLKSMFNDFLEGDDTDSVINRWKDLEAFLNGISEDNTLDSILKAYVTLSGTQTITGEKNFTGGLKVNGSPLVYNKESGYWKLEGDLLVTGGVSMFASDTEFTPSTIMDAIAVDNVTIIKQNGKLVALGGGGTGGGGVADAIAWGNVLGKPSWITDSAPSINVSGVNVSLGGSITQSALRTALGLGSNAYSSTTYLPSANYTASDVLSKLLTVDGSGSGLDADLLDGYHADSFMNFITSGTNYVNASFGNENLSKKATGDGYIEFWDGAGGWFNSNWGTVTAKSGFVGSLSGNASSATKLQTARTIWGQSFDGTANIDGSIVIPNNIGILFKDTDGTARNSIYLSPANNLNIGYATSAAGYKTNLYGNTIEFRYGTSRTLGMILNSSGNITIGSSDLASTTYKLYVNGVSNFNGNAYFNASVYSYNSDKSFRFNIRHNVSSSASTLHLYNIKADGSAYGDIRIGYTNGKHLTVASSGYIGVGTATPTEKLHVSGNILATGGVTTNDSMTINGIKLYKSQDGVLYLDGNLVVRGGVTMYGSDSESAPSILDSLPIASTTAKGIAQFSSAHFTVTDGIVSIIGSNVGLNQTELESYLTTNKFVNSVAVTGNGNAITSASITGKTLTLTKGASYLSISGGTISNANYQQLALKRATTEPTYGIALSFSNSNGAVCDLVAYGDTKQLKRVTGANAYLVYDSGNLSKTTLGLGNVENTALSTWVGTSKITTLGTITTGTWNGTKIANTYLANSAITISGTSVSLGGSITQSALRTALGLGSNAYSSTAYLPSSNYTASDVLSKLLTVDGSGSGLDADLLDGIHARQFTRTIHTNNTANSYVKILRFTRTNDKGWLRLSVNESSSNNTGASGEFIIAWSYIESTTSTRDIAIHCLYSRFDIAKNLTAVRVDFDTFDLYWTTSAWCRTAFTLIDYAQTCTIDDFTPTALSALPTATYTSSLSNSMYINASSATKLATARTIWGQSFDGTGNVSGQLVMPNNTSIIQMSSDGVALQALYTTSSNNLNIGYTHAEKGYNTYINGNNIYFRYGTSLATGIVITSTGRISTKVNMDLANGKSIYFKDTNGDDVDGIFLSASNNFHIGYGASRHGYNTYIDGNNIYLRYGTSNTTGLTLNSSGQLIIAKDVHMSNNMGIGFKDTDGTVRNSIYLSPANNLNIGYATSAAGYKTNLYGNTIEFRYGTLRTLGMTLNSSGNITIGSSDLASTTYKLYVNGMSYFNSQMNVVGNFYKYNAEKTYRLSFVNDSDYCSIYNIKADGSAYGNVVFQGNVGIGTTSPSTKLHVSGTAYASNFLISGTTGDITGIARSWTDTYNDAASNARPWCGLSVVPGQKTYEEMTLANYYGMLFKTGGSGFPYIFMGGNVGIGTASPSAKLQVNGNILATGGVTMQSARKLKNITDERGLSLDELSVIKPTRFTWKDNRDNKIHIGGIADDVMKVLPEVIYKTDDDTLTMDYGNAAFAIAASLIKPVVSHEQRIKVLEEENERLKREIEQLKWHIA